MPSHWLELRSPRLLYRCSTTRRELRKCFSASVDIFRVLLRKTTEVVRSSLQLNKTEILAQSSCPACYGPKSTGNPYQPRSSVKDSLILYLDGNFQHRHNAKAGKAAPLNTPPIFVEPERVDRMREDISNLAARAEPVDPCSDSHKAANDKRSETTWKGCDDISGELRCIPLAMLKKLFEDIDPNRPVGILYDIGCSLKKFLDLRDFFAFPSKKNHLKFGTSVFHAYVHEWQCQFHNSEGQITIIQWLCKKYAAAKVRRRQAKEALAVLLQRPNPFEENGGNYTRDFFTIQWEHQSNYLDNVTDEENERRTKLTKLLEKEESLNKLRVVLDVRDWDIQADLINRIIEEIGRTEGCQRELSEQLGILYNGENADIEKEKLLLLIWSSKRELYAKAVDIKGVRQPIAESQTRGRRVGTILKEKIFESINKRKTAVLRKYDEDLMNDPYFASLTWDIFTSLKLDDSFWDDIAFYGSQAPWAVATDVREGIRASHMLERAEEELDLIAQELDRSMTWAIELHTEIKTLATTIHDLPPNSDVVVTPIKRSVDQFSLTKKDPRPTESVFFSHQTTEMDGRRLVEKAGPNSWDEWSFTIAQGDNAAKLLDVGSRVQAYAFSNLGLDLSTQRNPKRMRVIVEEEERREVASSIGTTDRPLTDDVQQMNTSLLNRISTTETKKGEHYIEHEQNSKLLDRIA
ncbi:hypothetical protein MJO29_016252 [Puccinia striiformis f. sp. tritici]|nr:hypothetical protein MJO29_016252 [Puccinia striiformis f. sp. tritici]